MLPFFSQLKMKLCNWFKGREFLGRWCCNVPDFLNWNAVFLFGILPRQFQTEIICWGNFTLVLSSTIRPWWFCPQKRKDSAIESKCIRDRLPQKYLTTQILRPWRRYFNRNLACACRIRSQVALSRLLYIIILRAKINLVCSFAAIVFFRFAYSSSTLRITTGDATVLYK